MPEENRRSARARLVWATALAVGAVAGASVLVPSHAGAGAGAGESKALLKAYERAGQSLTAGGTTDTTDPTTPEEAEQAIEAVEAQRAEPDPELVPIDKTPPRRTYPQNRYAMAGGCYALKSATSGWIVRDGDGYAATGRNADAAEPFHLQATDLGHYLVFDSKRQYATPGAAAGDPITAEDTADESSIWKVTGPGPEFVFSAGDLRWSPTGDGTAVMADDRAAVRARLTDGCAKWPEITTNVKGRTFAGVTAFQEVRGTTDAHTHGMAFQFLSGGAHCGRPWSPFGVTVALVDCPDHEETGGISPLETALNGSERHDPVGWPTFKDWPAPDSLTHEGTYYKWMERAWKGGLRLFVNLLVENNKLCQLYPFKGERYGENPTCDDMESIRMQAEYMRDFERYIDAQSGGPGKGWYRIVKNPFQARKVINQGKLAVVMGIETSIPFQCSIKADQPECSEESIDEGLREIWKMGVRQMELVNKFDNALSGVAGDSFETGALVNGANFLETGSFWQMESCPEGYGDGVHDREQYATPQDPGLFEQRDGLFAAVMEVSGIRFPSTPLYGPAPHCNERGLTDLGEHLINRMAGRGMIFDPDHMSVEARKASLDLLEELDYSGVISSHSWSTPDTYPRIYELGGTVFPYAGDSTGFVEKWRQHLTWADPRYYFGFGYGADINGLGAQGNPRATEIDNPVSYPFKGWGGVTVEQQRSGKRVYDLNADGVAHYGLYPDWFEDLELIAEQEQGDGEHITTDMQRGAEAYLQMWERALGVSNDACREPEAAEPVSLFRGLDRGLSVRQVLLRAGQPHSRLGDTFTYCATQPGGGMTKVRLEFSRNGKLR